MRVRVLLLLLACLLCGCSGGASTAGGTAAPAPGPAARASLELRIVVPPSQAAKLQSTTLSSVEVEIVDPGARDSSTLSGFRLLASGHASVTPDQTEARVLIQGILAGSWDCYAYGRDDQGNVIAASMPARIGTSNLALVLTLQLVTLDPITTLTVTPANQTIARGTSLGFRVTDGQLDLTGLATWSSSDPAVASIDTTGVARGLSPGQVTITAAYQGKSASTLLTVSNATVQALEVTAGSVPAGLTLQLQCVGTLTDGTTQDLTGSVIWTSSPPGLATINAAGLATGLVAGTTSVTATLQSLTATGTLTVTSAVLQSLSLTPAGPLTLSSGVTRQLIATGTFSDGSNQNLTGQVLWASSNTGVATVSNTAGSQGLATSVDDGSATVSASLLGLSSSLVLNGRAGVRLIAPESRAVGSGFGAAVLGRGDWNGDGRPDLVAASNVTVRFLLNTPDAVRGVVWTQTDFKLSAGVPVMIKSGDINGDGKADVLLLADGGPSIQIYLGNGDGTFQPPATLPGGGGNLRSLAVGRFDGDAVDDVAVTRGALPSGSLDIYLGVAGLGITNPPAQTLAVGQTPMDVQVGLFNGDANPDLVLVNLNGSPVVPSTLRLFTGNGAGTFAAAGIFPSGGNLAFGEAVGDVNQDGNLDVVVAHPGSANIAFLAGNGAGGFAAPVLAALSFAGQGAGLADFNLDGKLDALAPSSTGQVLNLQLGNGDGTFQAPLYRPMSFLSNGDPVIADFDLDGRPDAIPRGDAFFATVRNTDLANPLSTSGGTNQGVGGLNLDGAVALGDMDGDGRNDVVVSNANTSQLSVLLQDASGSLAVAGGPVATMLGPSFLKLGDMDRDGKLDVVLSESGVGNVSVYLGNGDGTLQPPLSQSSGLTTPQGLSVTDFNNDQIPDVAVVDQGSSSVAVLLGQGNGSLSPATVFGAGGLSCLTVTSADFNRDGNMDVAIPDSGNPQVSVLLGNGAGSLGAPLFVFTANPVLDAAAGDFDRDGPIDLAISDGNTQIFICRGNGDGTFQTPSTLVSSCPTPGRLEAVDMDANGKVDLVVASLLSGGMQVLLGRGDGTFLDDGVLYDGLGALAVGRLDADARPDVVTVGLSHNVLVALQRLPFP